MSAAYEAALTILGLTPEEFWRQTPADTANMVYGFRSRENRRLMQKAWEIRHLLAPHMKQGSDLTVMSLFEAMPGSFPADLPASARGTSEGLPADLTPAQRKEALRRRNKQRLTSPRK